MRERIRRQFRVVILLVVVLALPVGIFVTARGLLGDRDAPERALPGDLVLGPGDLPPGAIDVRQLVIPTGSAVSFTTAGGDGASCLVLVGPGGEPIEGERFVAVADDTVNSLTSGLGLAPDPVEFTRDPAPLALGDQAVAFTDASGDGSAAGVLWRHGYATAGCFVDGTSATTDVAALADLQQEKLERIVG